MALRLSKEERDFPVCAEALPMKQPDDLSAYYEELLEGRYDCVDRIVLNGYFPLGQQAISLEKEGNCFVGGSFQALDQLADTLCDEHAIDRLADRPWDCGAAALSAAWEQLGRQAWTPSASRAVHSSNAAPRITRCHSASEWLP
ncbi:MAG: hypothetical protein J5X23_01015 [Candidatus Accumulibacter sp.]|uniref:hypothetical protein n=1 Tax=Accumulibacter sp. TaxID=2053492 RepID=UPI001B29FD3C|nr:hypothetical protein [Accumulibacter sp.]MBO3713588.1 hypothetical protein [Accumulibacter sp.]